MLFMYYNLRTDPKDLFEVADIQIDYIDRSIEPMMRRIPRLSPGGRTPASLLRSRADTFAESIFILQHKLLRIKNKRVAHAHPQNEQIPEGPHPTGGRGSP